MNKADLEIDKSTLHNTTNCIFDFTCLIGDKSCLCEVVASKEKDVVEIKSYPPIACRYCISLENVIYCTCPTRNEIYNRYKI